VRYGSVCSGIEAASVAWEPLGWSPAWFSEIASWPSKFLSSRYPKVPNHGSLVGLANRLTGSDRRIDLLVGGTPCQAFSVAGLRGGLTDERGNLTLEFARLAEALRPRWLVWENVPGVLSDGTNAFGCLLGALCELGYGLAWRVLDAQFFGVAQRRQRCFVVGHLGAAAAAGAVLFEPEGVRRNSPPSRAAREDVAGTLAKGAGGVRLDLDGHGAYIPEEVATTNGVVTQDFTPTLTKRATAGLNNDSPLLVSKWPASVAPSLTVSYATKLGLENQHALGGAGLFVEASFDETQVTSPHNRSSCDPSTAALVKTGRAPAIAFNARQDPISGPIDTDPSTWAAVSGSRVRRLTPRECERLQGFPDDYTAQDQAKDTPRYAALGNSMAVPVMRWIGERIALVDAALREAA
jgi:DNA (cytosine-5)-methyltransferase 1